MIPAPGRIYRGLDVDGDVSLDVDVCIVGSGAGGAVAASVLAAAGRSVVVLEAGGYHTSADFNMQEEDCYPLLYQEDGRRATSDLAIQILQGRAVGGTTVVNWTTSFRTPARVLEHWSNAHGIQGLEPEALAPHFDAVEKRLNVLPCDPDVDINANNRVLWDGCRTLGWHRGLVSRNVHLCFQSGYCGMGCPVDAKQSMLVTYIPDAVAAGATVIADCAVERVRMSGSRAEAVEARVSTAAGHRSVTVRSKVTILSAGALNTPALLLRSGVGNRSGRLGRRTFLHPTIATIALFDEKIDAFYGVPQSVYSHEFAEPESGMGFFIEAAPVHPMLAGIVAPGFGATQRRVMRRLAHLNALIALHQDGFEPEEGGGTVTLSPGRPLAISYDFAPSFWEAARSAMVALARIQLAAGAREVYTLHNEPLRIRAERDVAAIDDAPVGPNRVGVFSAHAMGGCAMGALRSDSVVDNHHRLHDADNLYVIDGSVLPTSLTVNPQLTIYAMARRAALGVADLL
jgi:choline dehydrogenase-like flavoprotein